MKTPHNNPADNALTGKLGELVDDIIFPPLSNVKYIAENLTACSMYIAINKINAIFYNALHHHFQQNVFAMESLTELLETTTIYTIFNNCHMVIMPEVAFVTAANVVVEFDADGDINLRGTGVTELPDNLSVPGGLYMQGTGVKKLPKNLKVGGDLDLQLTRITELPDDLEVGGDLSLAGSDIKKLPKNLKVGGDLYLYGTRVTVLPDNLEVGGWVYGFKDRPPFKLNAEKRAGPGPQP